VLGSEPVIEGYQMYGGLRREGATRRIDVVRRSADEGSAVQPQQHRTWGASGRLVGQGAEADMWQLE
jgi:hypothetical protein